MTEEEWERLYRSPDSLQTNILDDNALYAEASRSFAFPRSEPERERNTCWHPECHEQFSDFKLLLAHILEEHAYWREGGVNILHDLKTHGTQRVR